MSIKKYIAELIGTAALVFVGCGSTVFLGTDTTGGHLAVAFAFGLSIVSMFYVIGNISSCHINPAVSLAMFLSKKINSKDLFGYVIAQIIGALIGAGILKYLSTISGIDKTGSLGSNEFGSIGMTGSLVVEIILTFIFIFTVLGVTSDSSKANITGIIKGLALTFVHIIGIPLTGPSVNPARSLAPALIVGGKALSEVWVFLVAPLIGSTLAYLVFSYISETTGS